MKDVVRLKLEGLTPRQKTIADMLWEAKNEGPGELAFMIKMMPPGAKADAEIVMQMMVAEMLDQAVENKDTDLAKNVLAQFRI